MSVGEFIGWLDGLVWGTVMMVLIIVVGILLSVRTKFHPQRRLGLSLKYAVNNEDGAEGDVSSFGALTTALAATVGTGNIVGVSTAIMGGGPGALFWMELSGNGSASCSLSSELSPELSVSEHPHRLTVS